MVTIDTIDWGALEKLDKTLEELGIKQYNYNLISPKEGKRIIPLNICNYQL